MSNKEPNVTLKFYDVDSGVEGLGSVAMEVEFKDGIPEEERDMTPAQALAIAAVISLREEVASLGGKEVTDKDTVLSSIESGKSPYFSDNTSSNEEKVKDEIDQKLEELGIDSSQFNNTTKQ